MSKIITELSLEGKSLDILPAKVAERCGSTLKKLDLTGNAIKRGDNFADLVELDQLVLDSNDMQGLVGFPVMSKVNTLWLNKNCLIDLDVALNQINAAFPNITYLSMLFNPCVPNLYVDDSAAEAYQRYRYAVISRLPKLEFLDSCPVEEEERKEAARLGDTLKMARPDNDNPTKGPRADFAPRQTVSQTPPRVATFLAKGKPRYDGTNSEGNRFIMNDDL